MDGRIYHPHGLAFMGCSYCSSHVEFHRSDGCTNCNIKRRSDCLLISRTEYECSLHGSNGSTDWTANRISNLTANTDCSNYKSISGSVLGPHLCTIIDPHSVILADAAADNDTDDEAHTYADNSHPDECTFSTANRNPNGSTIIVSNRSTNISPGSPANIGNFCDTNHFTDRFAFTFTIKVAFGAPKSNPYSFSKQSSYASPDHSAVSRAVVRSDSNSTTPGANDVASNEKSNHTRSFAPADSTAGYSIFNTNIAVANKPLAISIHGTHGITDEVHRCAFIVRLLGVKWLLSTVHFHDI
jgi:hypothetical protein